MNTGEHRAIKLTQRGAVWVGEFRAMASPCEIQVEIKSKKQATHLTRLAQREAERIEKLFSRYRHDNVVHRINTANGQTITVDAETANILDFANQCYLLSEGLFDITSGVLREVWRFDGSDRVPDADAVAQLLHHVGWQKVTWSNPCFTCPPGMQIDLGGIGKEYAVDRTVAVLSAHCQAPFLVNFGGDLHAAKAPASAGSWSVGIESVQQGLPSIKTIALARGALTTSGDARRFLLKNGVRYSHVLNPLTGWPVENAPSSVTVAGNTCTEAGILSTLALLQGADAEQFLDEHGVTYWCQRDTQ